MAFQLGMIQVSRATSSVFKIPEVSNGLKLCLRRTPQKALLSVSEPVKRTSERSWETGIPAGKRRVNSSTLPSQKAIHPDRKLSASPDSKTCLILIARQTLSSNILMVEYMKRFYVGSLPPNRRRHEIQGDESRTVHQTVLLWKSFNVKLQKMPLPRGRPNWSCLWWHCMYVSLLTHLPCSRLEKMWVTPANAWRYWHFERAETFQQREGVFWSQLLSCLTFTEDTSTILEPLAQWDSAIGTFMESWTFLVFIKIFDPKCET